MWTGSLNPFMFERMSSSTISLKLMQQMKADGETIKQLLDAILRKTNAVACRLTDETPVTFLATQPNQMFLEICHRNGEVKRFPYDEDLGLVAEIQRMTTLILAR